MPVFSRYTARIMSGQEGFQTFANMQGMSGQSQHHHQDVSLYTSSQAASSSSSLIDQASDHGSMSSHHGSSYRSSGSSTKTGPGPSSNSQGFSCPNCGKTFARGESVPAVHLQARPKLTLISR